MRDSKSSLKNIRVLKKNMLFIQSYDETINKTTLKRQSFYETCGEVLKVKVKENFKNHTAYVTYDSVQSAAAAFMALFHLNQRMKVLFGTVQYCKYFIRRSECRNDQCVFLHLRDRKNEIIVKDEIDDQVYEEHYDMAVSIAEDEAFQTIRQILAKRDLEENLIKKGLRKVAEVFHLLADIRLEVVSTSPNRKLSELQESLGSTTEESLNQCREEPPSLEAPPPPNPGQEQEQAPFIDLQAELEREQAERERQSAQQKKQSKQAKSAKQEKQSESGVNIGEYIRIKLIKRLIREDRSKLHATEQQSKRQQALSRGNLMLLKIVKK